MRCAGVILGVWTAQTEPRRWEAPLAGGSPAGGFRATAQAPASAPPRETLRMDASCVKERAAGPVSTMRPRHDRYAVTHQADDPQVMGNEEIRQGKALFKLL